MNHIGLQLRKIYYLHQLFNYVMHDELMMYEIESKLLGKLLMHPELYYDNAENLESDLFSNLFHKSIFDKFLVMQSEQKVIDLVSMANALDCDHSQKVRLSEIFSTHTDYISVKSCVEQLQQFYKRKHLHAGINEALNMFINEESVDKIIEHINKVNSKVTNSTQVDVANINTQIKDFLTSSILSKKSSRCSSSW